MPLTPQQVLDRLVAILPAFGPYFASDEACFRDADGSFTACGAFGDCSHFVRAHYASLTGEQRRRLGDFVLECMTDADRELGDAAATCFLENLAFEWFSKDFESYLTGEALKLYRAWQGR